MRSDTKRLVWVDAIRAVGIFLVVYVHQLYLLPPLSFSTLSLWTPQLFSQVGVPLFVLVSGALLLPKKESLFVFFRKRVRTVLLPWIFWICVYSFIAIVLFHEQINSLGQFIRFEYRMFFSRFWFLPMIFGLYLLTPILRIFVQNARISLIYYSLFLWFLGLVVLPLIFVPVITIPYLVLEYMGLFVLGFVLVNKQVFISSIRLWIAILFLSMFATYTMTFFDSLPLYPQIDRTFSRIFSPTFLPGVIAVFMICFLCLKNVKRINTTLQMLITEVSKSILGIYLIHELIQLFLQNALPSFNNLFLLIPSLLAVPLHAAVVFSLSFVLIVCMRKIPILRLFA